LRQEKGGSEFLIRRKGPADAQGECGEDQVAGCHANEQRPERFRSGALFRFVALFWTHAGLWIAVETAYPDRAMRGRIQFLKEA
jgi:hypothetical protein